ncbi:hypothetical protein [Sorangium sp. So ce861]|uniref:hypothetical protein n=1 Tax=Sorangium sp. So ce861 TaxID=3133323 RepID=UPI003F61871C
MSRKRKARSRKGGAPSAPRPASSASPAPAAPPARRVRSFRLRLDITALELASGHDGLLRGAPEPVLLVAAYLLFPPDPGAPPPAPGAPAGLAPPRPLGRTLARFSAPQGRFPAVLTLRGPLSFKARARARDDDRILLLVLAVEEDTGKEVERLYAHLADAKHLRLWDLDAPVPSPSTLAELIAAPYLQGHAAPARVGVLDDGGDLRDTCRGDDFVGASAALVSTARHEDALRFHVVSADGRNDWTAVTAVSVD